MTADKRFCEKLNQAFDDSELDCVTLVTIIDGYCDLLINSATVNEDSYVFLRTLNLALESHPEVVYEIGWDLPKSLIKICTFFGVPKLPVDWKTDQKYVLIDECVDIIIKSGNPKEYFIACCDLLSSSELSSIMRQHLELNSSDIYSEGDAPDEEDFETCAELSLQAQFSILMKLAIASIENIDTVYPSKFLGMLYDPLSKYIANNLNNVQDPTYFNSLICDFLSNFRIKVPSESLLTKLEITKTKYESIKEEELCLCNHVKTSLLIDLVRSIYDNKQSGCDLKKYGELNKQFNYELEPEILDNTAIQKYSTLAEESGLNIRTQFENLVKESCKIYERVPTFGSDDTSSQGLPPAKLTELIYHLAYTHELKNLSESRGSHNNIFGILPLLGLTSHFEKNSILECCTLEESAYIYLHCSSCSLYSSNFSSPFSESISRYLLINSLSHCKSSIEIKKQISDIPYTIKNVFLQLLLMKSCNESNPSIRVLYFFIITQFLASMESNESFDFIIDTLLTCPFVEAKIIVIDILKVLLNKDINSIQSFINDDGKAESKVKEAPKLPPRPIIKMDDDIMAQIHSVYSITFESVVKDKRNRLLLTLLLSYLNLMIVLRDKWNMNLLTFIDEELTKEFTDEIITEEIPEIGFIQIAMSTLHNHISKHTT